MRGIGLVVALAVIAVAPAAANLTQPDLARRANRICARFSKLAEKLGQPELSNSEEAARYFGRAHRLARRQQRRLTSLRPDQASRRAYRRFTSATRHATRLLRRLHAAAKAGDRRRSARLVQRLTPVSYRVDRRARRVGADRCGG